MTKYSMKGYKVREEKHNYKIVAVIWSGELQGEDWLEECCRCGYPVTPGEWSEDHLCLACADEIDRGNVVDSDCDI